MLQSPVWLPPCSTCSGSSRLGRQSLPRFSTAWGHHPLRTSAADGLFWFNSRFPDLGPLFIKTFFTPPDFDEQRFPVPMYILKGRPTPLQAIFNEERPTMEGLYAGGRQMLTTKFDVSKSYQYIRYWYGPSCPKTTLIFPNVGQCSPTSLSLLMFLLPYIRLKNKRTLLEAYT